MATGAGSQRTRALTQSVSSYSLLANLTKYFYVHIWLLKNLAILAGFKQYDLFSAANRERGEVGVRRCSIWARSFWGILGCI